MLYYSYNLDLDPMTFAYKLDLYMLTITELSTSTDYIVKDIHTDRRNTSIKTITVPLCRPVRV